EVAVERAQLELGEALADHRGRAVARAVVDDDDAGRHVWRRGDRATDRLEARREQLLDVVADDDDRQLRRGVYHPTWTSCSPTGPPAKPMPSWTMPAEKRTWRLSSWMLTRTWPSIATDSPGPSVRLSQSSVPSAFLTGAKSPQRSGNGVG